MLPPKILLGISVCLLVFYITALILESEVRDVSCIKFVWYLTILNTTLDVISALNRLGAIILLGNHVTTLKTIFFWHKSKTLAAVFLFFQITEFASKGILLFNVLYIPRLCTKLISRYGLFWQAAELQASIFVTASTIKAMFFAFFLYDSVACDVFGRNVRRFSDVENPEPVPINHGIWMTVDEESKAKKLSVMKINDVEKSCSICKEYKKTHACIPCGHMCLCALCAEDLSKKGVKGQNKTRCPICRVEVDNLSRIYL